MRKICLPFFLFCLAAIAGLVSCGKDPLTPDPPAPTDPRLVYTGMYRFMICTSTTQVSNSAVTADTTYFDGMIYADPNSSDSLVINYNTNVSDNLVVCLDSTNHFPVTTLFGTTNGFLNQWGVRFNFRISSTSWEHVDRYVSGDRF